MQAVKISSPAFVVEGQSYSVRLTVTNLSTSAGIPVEAMLRIGIEAMVSLDAWVTETLIPTQEREEYFSANQTRTFDYAMNIPLGLAGYSGYIGAAVKDPTGLIILASASEPLVVEAAPEVGQWVSPTSDNGEWTASTLAYDRDLTTSAIRLGGIQGRRPFEFQEFYIEPLMCSGIRFYARISAWGECIVDIDIEFNDIWHHIYDSYFYEMPDLLWHIVNFEPQLITGARIRVSAQPVSADLSPQLDRFDLFEFEFWNGTGFPGVAPGARFAYASNVRYIYPYRVPSYTSTARASYQCFEVDVINLDIEPRECVLECYIRHRDWPSGSPWSSWRRDSDYQCTLWCRDPDWLCYDAEPYRIKRAIIQPGEIVTFRGLCWYHFFDDENRYIQAKFSGEPGEILSDKVVVEPYA